MSSPAKHRIHVRPGFLPLATLAKVLAAFDALSARWTSSEAMGLLGRGGALQIPPGDLVSTAQLDTIRELVAVPALRWAQDCGFRFAAPPQLQMFPVQMFGDPERPAFQEPHVDSRSDLDRPPICANVFYARVRSIVGGELEVAARSGEDLEDAVLVRPAANTLVSFPGDRVHRVRPLLAGERLSLVLNFY